jgi:hypothetical protein
MMSQREFNFEKEHGRDGLMITSAIRYCLGRRTYIVSDCCDWIVANWNDWPDNVKAIIRRDIEEAFTRDRLWQGESLLGDDRDKRAWEKVKALWGNNNEPT